MTEKPASVRIATPRDEDGIVHLMQAAWREQPIFPLNENKIREKIRHCTNKRGGAIGVIDGKDGIEAYLIGELSQHWYTDEWHFGELSNFVHPGHRKSSHAKDLIEFAKWFAEQLGMPLILGIMSTQRTAAKIRFYERQVKPCGALFVHNTGHADGMLSEMG